MKNIASIFVLIIFLMSCKGSIETVRSNQATENSNSTNTRSNSSPQQTIENSNSEQQNKTGIKQSENVQYKKASDVQNTSIKKQYPAAK